MTELICGSGHVYKGETCDRCGGRSPVNEVPDVENIATTPAPEKTETPKAKPAKKTVPKVVKPKTKKGKK